MSKRDRKLVRSALRGPGMRYVERDYMMKWGEEEPLPLWPELIEDMNRRQVEYHASKS